MSFTRTIVLDLLKFRVFKKFSHLAGNCQHKNVNYLKFESRRDGQSRGFIQALSLFEQEFS